jgi:hypothetical protein
MRLSKGGAYTSDIATLRNTIRSNGTLQNLQAVTVSHPGANITVNLYINLAFQPNGPGINASLYTVAFQNPHGIWNFDIQGVQPPPNSHPFPGNLTGDYASLGYPENPLPNISNQNLLQAIQDIYNYTGVAPVPPETLNGMARLIITVNEAVRFNDVETGIDNILGNDNPPPYTPPYDLIHNWNTHTIGS